MIVWLKNGDIVQEEQIGVASLYLSIIHVLKLKHTIYVPSMRGNLILVVALDHIRYSCYFGNGKFDLIYNYSIVGSSSLCDRLYRINLDLKFANFVIFIIRKKRCKIDKRFSMLWHTCLRYISREMMQRLIR